MQNGETLISRYDAEGLRYELEENERLVKFIFHKENVLVETDANNELISRFARGYEVVGAEIRNEDSNNYSTYYYHPDEQGSTLYITDETAIIKNHYFYDAFGNVLNSAELVHNRITYVGQQFDSITQQYYLRARYYNPIIGRFTQEDIYRGDGLNLYAYCRANPITYYDYTGYAGEKPVSSMTYREIKEELNQLYKEFVDMKHASVPTTSKALLGNELEFGGFGYLERMLGKSGDNITGYHMPSNAYMKELFNMDMDDSLAMYLEHISPGSGGRHRRTFTYGVGKKSRKYQLYSALDPRDALAFDLNDLKRILKEDGLYNKETKRKLNEYIRAYSKKTDVQGIFKKGNNSVKNTKSIRMDGDTTSIHLCKKNAIR